MIERIEEVPAGTIGLRASGKLTKSDYVDVLEPALREGVEGDGLRLLFVLTDFDGMEAGAIPEDFKTGMRAWFRDHSKWRRFALVTDVEWVQKATRLFAWTMPGEVLIRDLDGLAEAREWVAA